MALISHRSRKGQRVGSVFVEIYHPADAEQPFVTTEARYKTVAAAENDIIAIIASGANSAVRPKLD